MEEKQTIFQKFMGVVNKIGSAIMLNLLFLVSCIPVVTIGNATAGLYSAVRFSIRGDSTFQEGDTVVVVTSGRGVLRQLNDIFA